MLERVVGQAEEARWSIDLREPRPTIATIPAPEIPVTVTLHCDEITTLDPRTHQPDMVVADIEYRPQGRLIDSKSLHAYIVSLRNIGFSMERLATILASDVMVACSPAWVNVTVREKPRGGVSIVALCRMVEPSRNAELPDGDPFEEWARSH